MSNPSFLVAQLGARMNYAVPRILYQAGQLTRLCTDIAANRGMLRCLKLWPKALRPSALTRLLTRVPQGVPAHLIRGCTTLGISYARQFARTRSERERVELFLRVGERFGAWVVRQDWAGASGVFVYNTAGLEILRDARRRGLRTCYEQTIAPFAVERAILAQERARFPSWEPDSAASPALTAYANRERQEWECSDMILCGSEFVRDSIGQMGGPTERCHVVPYGVDARFDVPPAIAHDGPLRVLTVGAVGLRKGAPYAIEAARRLRGRAVFRWVGAFKMADAAKTELGDDVEFVGMVPRSEVVGHYAWADVFLLPSLCEGSATSTYEALTAGRPVLCTPNCGSVIRDGIEGYNTPIRDVDAMVDRLERLASDGDLRRQMAEAARRRSDEMNYEAYGRGLLAALNKGW
jgi:glycosyltransferase involved in cell wall biosynthesis